MRSTILAAAAAFAALVATTAAEACPDWRQNGAVGRFTGNELYDPKQFSITAGGDSRLSSCKQIYGSLQSDRGEGFFLSRLISRWKHRG